ncbi:hypothetical protein C2G38_2235444 [Gigaspora rosea]|uniref:Uncharacterized protein n=1 Tax=Gigaspora rosea TaxID=44941 RepID=A0A397TTY8_9GLOM|nr:hypothetical protein C2G38_2235444 [Gigaspora rosea]
MNENKTSFAKHIISIASKSFIFVSLHLFLKDALKVNILSYLALSHSKLSE